MAGKVRSGYLGHINSNAVQPRQRCQLATFWPARACTCWRPSNKLYAKERVLYATCIFNSLERRMYPHAHMPASDPRGGVAAAHRQCCCSCTEPQVPLHLCTQAPHSPHMHTGIHTQRGQLRAATTMPCHCMRSGYSGCATPIPCTQHQHKPTLSRQHKQQQHGEPVPSTSNPPSPLFRLQFCRRGIHTGR
jgi:hypothetical protein